MNDPASSIVVALLMLYVCIGVAIWADDNGRLSELRNPGAMERSGMTRLTPARP